MSEEEKKAGLTDSDDIDSRMKYKEIQRTRVIPKIKLDKKQNIQREISIE